MRGPQPWTFLPLLTDGFEDTIRKRYPGLEFDRMVPCPGQRKDRTRCDYEWTMSDLEGLRWPQNTDDDREIDVRCPRCRTKFQIDSLLLGLSHAPARDAAKLEEILCTVQAEGEKTREHISVESDKAHRIQMGEIRRFVQLAFVKEWNSAQELEEQSCPTIFALYPVGGKTLTKNSKLHLQLYCMNPDCLHSIGPDGMCEFQPHRAGFITATRWVRMGLNWLRPLAALLPSGSHVAGEFAKGMHEFAERADHELKFTADVFKELKEIPEVEVDGTIDLEKGSLPNEHSEKVELRQLKAFLDHVEFPVKPYGGLKRVRTPEGHILWLCADHAKEFAASP